MIKTKYEVLSKEKRKSVRKGFFGTDSGKKIKKYFLMADICAILCAIYGVYMIIDNTLNNKNIAYYIYAVTCIIVSIFLLIKIRRILVDRLSRYVIKNKK